MIVPMGNVCIRALGKNKNNTKIKNIEVLGSIEKLLWEQYTLSMDFVKPKIIQNDIAVVFKIK
jgi:alpha-L-fucosidase